MSDRPLPYLEVFQSVGEVVRYAIDWEDWLVRLWDSGRVVSSGTRIRPTVFDGVAFMPSANGLQYNCSVAGATGEYPPAWPTIVGGTVIDGGVTWTAEAMSTASLETTLSTAPWPSVPGLTLSGAATAGQTAAVMIDTAAAVAGRDYDVVNVATMADGQIKRGLIRVKVR